MDFLDHYLQIIILGIVEGVTEFLPISSTGHLLIAEHLMGTQMPDIFNVVIQAGAILAVVFIYWHKIMDLLGNLDRAESRNYLIKIFIAFVVTTVLYLVVSKLIGHHKLTESLGNVAWATLIGGLVIFAIEAFAKHLYPHEDVSWFEALLVGVAQVLAAIFPGTSRSGATIMSGLSVGMKRTAVTEFSFLVGIPTMFAASAFATLKSYKAHELNGVGHQLIIDTAIGFFVSLVVAFFVVKWLLRFVQSHTFNGFAIYRVLLGGGLLIGLYTHAIPDVGKEDAQSATVPAVTPLVAPVAPEVAPATNMENTPSVPATTNVEVAPLAPVVPEIVTSVPSTNAEANPPRAQPVTAEEMTNESRPIDSTNSVLTPGTINQPVFNVRKLMTNQTATPEPPAPSNVPAPQN